MENMEDALKAIKKLNSMEFKGRQLLVQYHVPKRTAFSRAAPTQPTKTLFIGNMSYQMTDKDLNELFRSVRNVLDVRVAIDRRSGQPRGFAHADFVDSKSAQEAMDFLRQQEFFGRKLRVDFSAEVTRGVREPPKGQ
jgi:nucleolin